MGQTSSSHVVRTEHARAHAPVQPNSHGTQVMTVHGLAKGSIWVKVVARNEGAYSLMEQSKDMNDIVTFSRVSFYEQKNRSRRQGVHSLCMDPGCRVASAIHGNDNDPDWNEVIPLFH